MTNNIGMMLSQVVRLLRRAFDERARRLGTTRPQWQALMLIDRNPGINQGRLADLLEVEPITLGRMVDRLQEGELVERRPDPADRRAWRLHLTDKGRALYSLLEPHAQATVDDMLEGIDEAGRAQLIDALERMRLNLINRIEGENATRPTDPHSADPRPSDADD